MAVEAIQKVTQVEAEADRRKEEAMAESKQKLLVAQRAAQRLLADSRTEAENEARQMLVQTEEEAAKATQKVLEQAKLDCEQWKRTARTRLNQAARTIVEKVVNR